MKHIKALFAAGLFLGSISPAALAERPAEPPKEVLLEERLQELEFFVRDWSCITSSAGQSDKRFYLWKITSELNGFWLLGRGETLSGEHLQQDTFGFNTILNKFGRTILGNDSTFANFLSNGWEDNRMVWVGTSSDLSAAKTGKHKLVMTRISDNAFKTEEFRAVPDTESWEAIATQSCKTVDETLTSSVLSR